MYNTYLSRTFISYLWSSLSLLTLGAYSGRNRKFMVQGSPGFDASVPTLTTYIH